jgi:hypothetical protein
MIKPARNVLPAAYLYVLPWLQEIADKHGYALALHGSMARDLDVVAVPWTDEASKAEDLIENVLEELRPYGAPHGHVKGPDLRPHGRKAWAIQFGNGPYLDISVMPTAQPPAVSED